MKNIIFIPLINLIFLIQLIKKSFNSICNSITTPFLKNNSCISFCSKEELNSKQCVISNEIVKIQYISNLIIMGSKDYRYINIASDESNNMVIQTSKFEGSGDRLFYGLKNNGRFIFMNGENESPYLSYIITGEATEKQQRFEGESCFIKLCDSNYPSIDEKNYFLSIAKADQYTELFDFESLEYTVKSSINFIGNEIYSDRGTFIRLYNTIDTEYNYYYLYAGVNKESSSSYKCILKSFYVNKKDISQLNEVAETEKADCSENKMISCFETKQFKIVCFYRVSYSSSIFYYITLYSCCFDEEKNFRTVESGSPNTFFKGIHLKEEIGIFIYFSDEESTNPIIFFKYFPQYETMSDYKNFGFIPLDYEFNNYYMLNDIIKISETKICYISPNLNNDVINVAILSLFNNDKNLNIRYYSQLIYEQNHYMIFKELRLHLYINQYITLAASVCNTTNCVNDDDDYYASFFIFSYPNSNDVIINLVNLLYKTNEEITKISFNLEEYTTIENNLFGFVFKGIQIISYPDNIQLISTKTNLQINAGYNMSKDENFTLNFGTTNIFQINTYNIEYAFIITEGDYKDISQLTSKNESYGDNSAEEQYGGGTYRGRTSYFKIIIDQELTTIGCNNDDNDICSLCLTADNNICVTCKDNEGNPKICERKKDQSTTIPSPFSSTLISPSFSSYSYFGDSEESLSPFSVNLIPEAPISYNNSSSSISNTGSPNTFECNITQILENKCKEGEIVGIQIEEIHNSLKENLKDFNNTEKTIETKNVVFQQCTLEQQKNSFVLNISSIDLGECESVIKEKEGLTDSDELIVIKTDIKDEESKSTYVQYELYHPKSKHEIDLSICENKITINVPVYLDNNIEEMNDKLNESGYNLFDKNDSFYNDICTKFTTKNRTDIILTDRRNDIYGLVKKISLCQEGCNFEYYNSTSKKAICVCNIQENSNFISDIKEIGKSFDKDIIFDIFSKGIINSNFLVLKCYKLALYFKDHIYNYGCITLTLLILVFIAFMTKYFIKDRSIINEYIQIIISQCFCDSGDKNKKSKSRKHIVNSKSIKLTNEKLEDKEKKILKLKDKLQNNEGNYNIKKSVNAPPKRQFNYNNKDSSKNDNDSKTKMKIKSLTINNLIINNKSSNPQPIPMLEIGRKNLRNTKSKTRKKNEKKNNANKNINNNKDQEFNYSASYFPIYGKRNSNNQINNSMSKSENKKMNDFELNSLKYRLAINLDKRNFFQYYFSLLKIKHLILFAFIPNDDYNIRANKICFFIISFSLYFVINGFFFNDNTMHDIYSYNGAYNLLNQISIIFYSSIISFVVQNILKLLCLSEKYLINLKKEKKLDKALKKSITVKKCLMIKFLIFYALGILLMIFFWYFITSFCAVYHNTQIILIKDTLISFAISMLYPFCINLIPGIFRKFALTNPKKNKKCLYKISLLFA